MLLVQFHDVSMCHIAHTQAAFCLVGVSRSNAPDASASSKKHLDAVLDNDELPVLIC